MIFSITSVSGPQGGLPCRAPSPRLSYWMMICGADWKVWSAPVPAPRRWPSAVASSCGPPSRTTRPTRRLPPTWTVIVTPSASGANASLPAAWKDSRMHHAPAGPGAFPPDEQLAVGSIATSTPQGHDGPGTGWTLDEIAATMINEAHAQAISRATIWRILDQADLKPHQSVYWLNSHDPNFQARAREICRLYLDAPRF